MSTNEQIIQKADLALADLASGGKLTEEQSNSFIRQLIAAPTIIRNARVVPMNAQSRQINKIGFGSRILRPGVEGTALAEDAGGAGTGRSKPTFGKVNLNAKEVIAEIRLPYYVIEDNIERGNLNMAGAGVNAQPVMGGIKDTIVAMIAERAALDLEELAILGDTGSGDAYLALMNGFLAQSTSYVVNAAGATISKTLFKQGIQAMPDQYLRNRAAMRHYISVNQDAEYRDSLAGRETGMGDAAIQGIAPVYGFGTPVEAVSLMPNASGLFTHPLNMIMGIQRDISMEVDKIITERVFVIVVTAKIDFKIEEETATVKYTNMG